MRRRPARIASASIGVLLVAAVSLLEDVQPRAAMRVSEAVQNGGDPDQLVERFFTAADKYEETFRNLVAEETKTIEVFDASGVVEKRRQIVSDLLVYRSPREGSVTTEYRDVRAVDGKAITNRGERALKLVTRASRANSPDKELEAINRETYRYEFHRHLRGFAIHQGGVFKSHRAAFQVETVGRETMNGRDIVVLDYRQTAPVGGFVLAVPKEFGNPPRLHRGRLWLDAETGQLWRDVWELVVPHPAAAEPLVVLRQERTYGPSRFGILTPERIVFEWFTRFSHPKKGRPSLLLSERTTFTYDSFRRFDVTTDEKYRGR